MALNFTSGKIIHIGQIVSGVSPSGKEWQSQIIVLESENSQTSVSRIALKAFGQERINMVTFFKVGDFVRAGWAIYAHEKNGVWYNNVEVCTIESEREGRATAPKAEPKKAEPSPAPAEADHTDDLPF